MNKTERKLLASLVADMKYKNETVPELIDYARIITYNFPSMKEELVEAEKDVLEDSIVGTLKSHLRRVNNPLALSKNDNKVMISKFDDVCYTILWDLLEETDSDVFILSDKLKEYHDIKNMVASEEWRTVVGIYSEDEDFIAWCTKVL